MVVRWVWTAFFSLWLLAACGRANEPALLPPPTRIPTTPTTIAQLPATATLTPAPTSTPWPTATPTITLSPTPTPTLTPTAIPLLVVGDPFAGRRQDPIPQPGARCGVVDILDFPLNPPDAAGFAGGNDFGVFRSRYDKFHAGEDWWASDRGDTFGQSVYSIGHGLITYAQPEGWNRDKGVIIIQHTFANGQTVLSFYGHLDPPSVTVSAGACVKRGEKIAEIGRPRGSPHLHFEIRTQSPYSTLSGYWPTDPTEVGWLAPSPFIWNQRIASAPGVLWTLPYERESRMPAGRLNETTFVVIQAGELLGLNLANGAVQWRYAADEPVAAAFFDSQSPILYTADRTGRVTALGWADQPAGTAPWTPLWQVESGRPGTPTLIPLAAGGVAVHLRSQLHGYTSEGQWLWTAEGVGQPTAWHHWHDEVIVATGAGSESQFIWQIGTAGAQAWDVPMTGRLAAAGEQLWLHTADGLYRLHPESRTANLALPLPRGFLAQGDTIGLPDGGLLLAHADSFDRRLLVVNADGTLRWERSYRIRVSGKVHLLEQGGHLYLVAHNENGSVGELLLYAIDLEGARLTHLFIGGTRSPRLHESWVWGDDGVLLLNIGGGNLLTFAAQADRLSSSSD